MRIAFVDFAAWNYTVESPLREPLGGSQSAICYLAQELARLGHEVCLLNGTLRAGVCCGVKHFGVSATPGSNVLSPAAASALAQCDVAVLQNVAGPAERLKTLMNPRARLILWTQHAHDQPAMQSLGYPDVRAKFDAFALISDWQCQNYVERFSLAPARCRVLRNAPGPPFVHLFADGREAFSAKAAPPVLAYTSTPFRGLDLLLDLFPLVRQAVPGVRLRVFSSMQVYHVSAAKDTADYGHLYRRCLQTEGAEYVGSLAQPELAAALRNATVLAYPNHFAETSCISVMEAMAAGLRVVTSRLGALPETLAGFGSLVPVDGNWHAYRERFAAEIVRTLESVAARPDEGRGYLSRQLDYVRQSSNWPLRAREWNDWLRTLCEAEPD